MDDMKSQQTRRYNSIVAVVSPQLVNAGNIMHAEVMMHSVSEENHNRLERAIRALREVDDILNRRAE